MIRHYLDDLVDSSKNILLLQGPVGAFFYNLAQWLEQHKKTIFKLNFNAGDDFFYSPKLKNTFSYQAPLAEFDAYLEQFCLQHQIDNIVCFGDNRPYHKIAKNIADKLRLTFWAFEEGYFRPHYITLEKSGVNAFSPIPREADFFLNLNGKLPEPSTPVPVSKGFIPMARRSILYYFYGRMGRKKYPHYKHHRITSLYYYIKLWAISIIHRIYYMFEDRNFAKQVQQGKFGEYFIVPLQVYDDSQVVVHSDYESVESFLREVLESFQHFAPKHFNLIIKHHPMDRGFLDYSKVIKEFEQKYSDLKGRLYYIHDVPMPIFLRKGKGRAKGMVTLNSTSGLSGLLHRMPVLTLGRANYHINGMTHQGPLNEFWKNPQEPNEILFDYYHKFHLNKTQINGNFYNKVILKYPYNNSK